MRLSVTLMLCLVSTTASAVSLRLPHFLPVQSFDLERDIQFLGDRLDGIDGIDSMPLDADGCPVLLTAGLCRDPSFWDTPCGQIQLADPESACAVPLKDALVRYAMPLEEVLVQDPLSGGLVGIPLLDSDEDIRWDGFDATFSPVVLSTLYPGPGDAQSLDEAKAWWDENCSVQSCEEYAYESYQDYSSWEFSVAAPLAVADWRQVFESAYASDGIARRTLYSSDGEPLPALDIDARRDVPGLDGRRNAFVGFDAGDGPRAVRPLVGFTDVYGTWDPVVLAPWILEILGELPPAASGPAPVRVDQDVIEDILEYCRIADTSGQMVCNPGALTVSREIATAFNAHLVPFDDDQVAQIRTPDVAPWPPVGDSWDVHRNLADGLVSTPDETLLWLERRQEQFHQATRSREDAWKDLALAVTRRVGWNSCINDPISGDTRCIDTVSPLERATRAFESMRAADLELSALLDIGEVNGCFGPAPTPCDWSPRWPALAFLGHFQDDREALYQSCIARTGNDFRLLRDGNTGDATPHWLLSQQQQRLDDGEAGICASVPSELQQELADCAILDDYLASPRSVGAYFDTVDAWVETLRDTVRLDPETGRPAVGGSSGDSLSLGGELFGADVFYDAGWAITGLEEGVCHIGGELWGRFGAGARVFGTSVPPLGILELDPDTLEPDAVEARRDPGLVNGSRAPANLFFADVHSRAGDEEAAAHVVLDLLGQNLYAEAVAVEADEEPGYTFHWSEPLADTRSQTFVDGRTTIFLGPVPVNLGAGAAGSVGFSARATVDAEACVSGNTAEVDSTMRFEPTVGAYGFADASAGISGLASVGVDSNLILVEAGLPLVVDASAFLDPENETSREDLFTITADLDLDLTLLRGRVRVYVELLLEKLAKTILVVPGITERLDLFDTSWSVDLAALSAAIGSLTDIPDPSLPNDGVGATQTALLVEDRGVCVDHTLSAPDVYLNFNDTSVVGGTLSAVVGTADFPLAGASTSLQGIQGQSVAASGAGLAASSGSIFGIGPKRAWSLWYRPDGGEGTLLSRGTANDVDQGMVLGLLSDGRVRAQIPCAEGGNRTLIAPAVSSGDWHHVALSLGTDIRLMSDGETAIAEGCTVALSGFDVTLGAESRPGGVVRPFQGRLDELGYWSNLSRDFIATDAAELRAKGLGGLPLAGQGSAPLTGITELSTDLVGNALTVSWTPPPSLVDPGHGYTSVIVTVGRDDYIPWDGTGIDRYEGTASSATLTLAPGDNILKVATYGITNTGVVVGPRREVLRPVADLPEVASLVATPGEDRVALSWRLPGDPRIARVQVFRGIDGPPTSPQSGLMVYEGRGESTLDVGLPVDADVHYSIWTVDGTGRRSPGVSLSTATVSGVPLDTTAPAPVLELAGDVTGADVALSWTLPADPDPLQVEITRGLAGLPGPVVYRGAADDFVDDGVAAGVPYTWRLRTVDPSGNLSTPTLFQATPAFVSGLALLDAAADDTDVDLLFAPADPATAMETVVVRGAVSRPSEGAEICRRPAGIGACIDEGAPLGEPVFYTGFVYDGLGRRSDGVISDPVTLEVSQLGVVSAPTTVHVGELVRLHVGPELPEPYATILDDGPRLMDRRSSQPWFRASTPGTVRVRVSGDIVGGISYTETLEITVVDYTGDTAGFSENPFVDLILPSHDRLDMAVDDSTVWATQRSGSGDAIVAVDFQGNVVRSPIPGTWPTMRHADGGRVLLADDHGSVELWRMQDPPELKGAENAGHGLWRGDVKGFTLAYAVGNTVLVRDILSDLVDLGTLTLPGPSNIASLALSDDAQTLYVSRGSAIEIYDLSVLGLGGPPVIASPTPVHVVTKISSMLAVDGDRLASVASSASSALSVFDLSDPWMPISLGTEDAGAYPEGLVLAHDHALVQLRDHALAYTTDTFAPIDGVFAHNEGVLADAVLMDDFGGEVEVWLSSKAYQDVPTTGIATASILEPLAPIVTTQLPDVYQTVVPAFESLEEEWSAIDFNLLSGTRDTLYETLYTPDFDFFETLCMAEYHVLVVQDPGVVTRFSLEGFERTTWTLPTGCDRVVCSDENLLMQCSDTWVAADPRTGSVRDTVTVPPTDFFAVPQGEALVGLAGDTVVARTLVDQAWEVGTGDGVQLVGYPGSTPATLWSDALYTRSFSGMERFDLGDGSSSTVTSGAARVDAGAGLAVSLVDGRLEAHWLEEHMPADSMATQLPAPDAFELTADGGHAFTLDGSVLEGFDTITAFLEPGEEVAGVLPLTLTWTGPDALPICQVTGGSCTIDSVSAGSATLSWTLPTVGSHELSVAVGDVRWMTTARDRHTVGVP